MSSEYKTSILFLFAIFGLVLAKNFVAKPQCSSDHHELWPHPNPNSFWYCDHKDVDAVEMNCPQNRGFLRIEGKVSGCVPWSSWECTSKDGKPSCKDGNYVKPHRHENPNKFYACTQATIETHSEVVEVDCLDWPINGDPPRKGTRGFVDNDHNLGCVPWEDWVCNKFNDTSRH